ncbi:MAG: DUF378 domain-containing protein [Myxococcota bacterium]
MRGNNVLGVIALVLAIIGAVNWGLIGFFNFNVVDAIFGGGAQEETSQISRVFYAIVGLAGIVSLFFLPRPTTTEKTTRYAGGGTPATGH